MENSNGCSVSRQTFALLKLKINKKNVFLKKRPKNNMEKKIKSFVILK